MVNPIQKPVKLLVTHQNPDPDAIGAVWLLMKFGGRDFDAAQFYFVPAGDEIDDDTLEIKEIARDEVVHVDTGMGVFDHHQEGNRERDSAILRVFDYLSEKYKELKDDEALKRIVDFLNELDHFANCYWPEANDDRYVFQLEDILKGLRSARHFNDRELVEFGMICLDGVYTTMKIKVAAEDDLEELGQEFESKWGKALAIQNHNDDVMKLAQKSGYQLVVRKDEERGGIRIKAVPGKDIDLTPIYEQILEKDHEGTWYFHPEKTMLINGSAKNLDQKPSPLSLEEVVEMIKKIR